MSRGQLILIEGLDRTGKSTQVELLVQKLIATGKHATSMKFPQRSTPIGKIINTYLVDKSFEIPDQAAHLLFSANRWELQQEIVQLLNDGHFIILDRYIYSGIAYSLAKQGTSGSQLGDLQWLYSPDIGLPKPDLTLFLDINVEELGKRLGWGEERYETVQFQKLVQKSFYRLFIGSNGSVNDDVQFIDVNNKSIDQVAENIWDQCNKLNKITLVEKEIGRFTTDHIK